MKDSTSDSHDGRHRIERSEYIVEEDQYNIFKEKTVRIEHNFLSGLLSTQHCSKLFVNFLLNFALFPS